tara:strand:- start:5186 stop:6922 length:1737 start_codon:yes stop_codon:yes gene_type:complete
MANKKAIKAPSAEEIRKRQQHAELDSKIMTLLEDFPVEIETTRTSRSINHILRWSDARNRVDPSTGYAAVIDKVEEERLQYERQLSSSDSIKPVVIGLPVVKGFPKTSKLTFKFSGTQSIRYTFNSTIMNESMHAWYLSYLLSGGTGDLTVESINPDGNSLYQDFDRKIGKHVATWGNTALMSDCRMFLSENDDWRISINQACRLLQNRMNFSLAGSWIIDRPDDLDTIEDPYDVYNKAGAKLQFKPENDKWNPGDIWFINSAGKSILSNHRRDFTGIQDPADALNALNQFNGVLMEEYENGNIMAISLKKMGIMANGYVPHFDIVNSKNYFDEEVLLDNRKGIVLSEFNQDVQIYLRVRKVTRDPDSERILSRDSFYAPEIFLKLKTITGGFRIELYIQGTEARHGSLGTKSYQKAIYNTDTKGIDALKTVREKPEYSEISDTLKGQNSTDEWIAFKVVRDTESDKYNLIYQYLQEIFNYVNGPLSRVEFSEANIPNENFLQSKIVASELGFAVKAVENKKRMDIICENLYRIAASKGITYGSTAQVREIISKKEPLLTGIGARNIVMNSSIHAKVY